MPQLCMARLILRFGFRLPDSGLLHLEQIGQVHPPVIPGALSRVLSDYSRFICCQTLKRADKVSVTEVVKSPPRGNDFADLVEENIICSILVSVGRWKML